MAEGSDGGREAFGKSALGADRGAPVPSVAKTNVLRILAERYGRLKRLERSQSLYELPGGAARIYIRYSAMHRGRRAFFGLRAADLMRLEGRPSVICLVWDSGEEPLVIPFSEFEEVFHSVAPAGDGQYKVQLYLNAEATELYVARAGRFNVDMHMGWLALDEIVGSRLTPVAPDLSHCQVQTLLGSIGALKGFDIWVPLGDRGRLDWDIAHRFCLVPSFPQSFRTIQGVVQEVDVVWIRRGAGQPRAFFEVEHSTPIYGGLLRFNDIRLIAPNLEATFNVVANDERRDTFVRQLNRPTFMASGLANECTFMDYPNVFGWYCRASSEARREVADAQ